MTQTYYSLITNNGLLKEAAANISGGINLNLTHIAVGDGNGANYNPTGAQTALVHELYRTTLTHVAIDSNNPNQLIVEGVISEEIGSFYIREVGIFDSDGELFAIGKYPETFKSTSAIGSGKRLYIRMILGFTNSPNVNLILSEDLNNDPNFNANVLASLDTKLSKLSNLSDLENAEEARQNLGLKIDVDVQKYDAKLSSIAKLFSNRNIIINGDFNIWQRGTYFSNVAEGNYTADRWKYYRQYTTAFHDISRSVDVPSVAQAGRLFNYSLLVDCQVADPVVAANKFVSLVQILEGYNFLQIAQKTFTLSFWVKATKPGIYCAGFVNSGADRSFVAEYNVSAADTWEYKTITILPSPVAGSWNYSNGVGLFIEFTLLAGSNRQTTKGQWQNGDFEATVNQVNACDSIANNFRICGVQIEAGEIATPFENRSISQELFLCQRYCEKFGGDVVNAALATAYAASSTRGYGLLKFKVEKRSQPTTIFSGGNHFRFNNGTNNYTSTSITAEATTLDGLFLNLITSGLATNSGGVIDTTASGYIITSCDL